MKDLKGLKGLCKKNFKKNRTWELDGQEEFVNKMLKQSKSSNPKLAKEAEEALLYLNQFNLEFHDGSELSKKETLHNTPELKRDCYTRNNCQNRDLVSIKTSSYKGGIESIEKHEEKFDEAFLEDEAMFSSSPDRILEFLEDESELERQRREYGKNFTK